MDDVWEIGVTGIKPDEATAQYCGRSMEIFNQAEKEGIMFPGVALGYLTLRGMRLEPKDKAVVLAASNRSYEVMDITRALKTTFKKRPRYAKSDVHAADAMNEVAAALATEQLSQGVEDLFGDLTDDCMHHS